jgi:NAD(P)-dependent dehydrogenase (short-subunit alcohol dehydrogenase family)
VIGVSRSISQSDFAHPSFVALPAEISSRESAAAAVDQCGRIDVLVHLMGAFAAGSDEATLGRMFDLNFRSAYHMIEAVLPAMRKQNRGAILAIGSRTAVEPQPMLAAYSASKAALVSLIRTVALENKDKNISANVVLLGTMDTPANRTAMPDADYNRWVQPCQIASLLVHLASDRGAQLTGAVIPFYGGEL